MSCFEEDGVRKQIFLYVARRSFFVEELKVKLVRKGFGSKAIWYKLYRKVGIDRFVLQRIVLETEKNQLEDLKRLVRKSQETDLSDSKQRERLIRKYLRRGYRLDEIIRCLAE